MGQGSDFNIIIVNTYLFRSLVSSFIKQGCTASRWANMFLFNFLLLLWFFVCVRIGAELSGTLSSFLASFWLCLLLCDSKLFGSTSYAVLLSATIYSSVPLGIL